jgi:hypothetical protein
VYPLLVDINTGAECVILVPQRIHAFGSYGCLDLSNDLLQADGNVLFCLSHPERDCSLLSDIVRVKRVASDHLLIILVVTLHGAGAVSLQILRRERDREVGIRYVSTKQVLELGAHD